MNDRVIRHDKNGVYVICDRRRFRPISPTMHKTGDKVSVSSYSRHVRVADAKTQVIVQTYVSYPVGHPLNTNARYAMGGYENVETWENHEADPRLAERLKKGFTVLTMEPTRGSVRAVVAGADGYDFGLYRRDPTGYKPHHAKESTRGINVHIEVRSQAGHAQFTWDDWDKFVEEINSHRDEVQVAPIAAKLQQEVDLDDQLQDYIAEKGLADV